MQNNLSEGSVTYGYNNIPWIVSNDPKDVFYMAADPIRRPLLTLKEELLLVLNTLYQKYGEEFHILYSGGADSEAVIEGCRIANLPHKIWILRDTTGVNREELVYARDYLLKTKSTNFEVLEFDFNKWVETKECRASVLEFNQRYASMMVQMYPFLTGLLNDKVVLMGHDPVMSFNEEFNTWGVTDTEYFYSRLRFFAQYSPKSCPGPYSYNTEILHCWLSDPVWEAYCQPGKSGMPTNNDSDTKAEFWYRNLGLTKRKRIDWTHKVAPWINYTDTNSRMFWADRKVWLAEHIPERFRKA
jgi:hypothetical protein